MIKKRVVIVGGGAAGFFAAANLDEEKYSVRILEQNKDVLQKVKISGGGRCNVTQACFDPQELVGFYPRGHKELRSVFHQFQPGDTMAWFEARGVPLKIERDNRVFPESNSSQSITDALQKAVADKGFEVLTKTVVSEIIHHEERYTVKTGNGNFEADYLIYTTGSAPKSVKILENLDHSTVPAVPSLFTFNVKDELINPLPGTSFPMAEVSIPKLKTEESGPMLITHWGLSGPAILKISAWKARELFDLNYKFDVVVNFIAMSADDAVERLVEFKEVHPKKTVGQAKVFEVTNRFWLQLLHVCKIDANKQVSQLSKKEVRAIAENLCRRRLTVSGKSTNKDEFVTAGGVKLKEIDFKTMESKLLPNFYIAGEVLDIDAVTGGFNFQACWSEAWLIAQALNEKT
ncbi:MAG: NAD(P)/FAD-dependent oxidoreductase [Chryseobacterium sp.]|nr:MAG: NAD(P)/FAD-dependent oxidoreductase [Chryseobacterium sp.]